MVLKGVSSTALVPMRAQPLHFGHVNLLLNMVDHFDRVVVLLSDKQDKLLNPFSFSERKDWLRESQKRYNFQIEIEKLPEFPSSIERRKSSADILSIQKIFSAIGGDNFSIVTGNTRVAQVGNELYGLSTAMIGKDIVLERNLEIKNPFEYYEDNGQPLREHIFEKRFSSLSCCVPDFVIRDCESLMLQKSL